MDSTIIYYISKYMLINITDFHDSPLILRYVCILYTFMKMCETINYLLGSGTKI